jgi:DNA-binding beta-propeller fold protein YncE
LTVVAGSPFAAGTQPSSIAVDPTGMFTYVVNSGSDTVSVFAIDATSGALTPIGGSPFATGTQPAAIAISD